MAKRGKSSIEIYKSWCKRCGICVAFCPAEVLAQDESGVVHVKDPERCTGCLSCEFRCPDFAIHVRPPKKKVEKGKEKTPETMRDGQEEGSAKV
jgi:2-oxoglutarate ferredoxin oxidoreductase subunit delta